MTVWTKELVQKHAQVAAAIELYTIPFYTTVMTSIKDEECDACKILHGILIEEMMHLQLAANLCLALDTTPNFQFPAYGTNIPYLKPGTVLNAKMGPLNAATLNTMLAIETPEHTLGPNDPTPDGNNTPTFPYSSIGEMYHALICGIQSVGASQFSWTSRNQQARWIQQEYPQIICNDDDAKEAVTAIEEQGEGRRMTSPIQKPYKPSDFPVESQYQMDNRAPAGAHSAPYQEVMLKQYSHFGRLLYIQQTGFPDVYTGQRNPTHPTNNELQGKFMAMIGSLNPLWTLNQGSLMSPESLWRTALDTMRDSAKLARQCWQQGVIPTWFHLDVNII